MAKEDKITLYVTSGDQRFELPYIEPELEIKWFFRERMIIEKAMYDGDDDIYSYRRLGDRYFMTTDHPDYELFGEPTHYQYWLFNVDREHSIVVGDSSKRLNFNEVSKTTMLVVFEGHDEDFNKEFHPDLWGED